MAKFKIDSINYCAAGSQGKFINVDYSVLDSDGQVERKVKNATFVTDYRSENDIFFGGDGKADLANSTNEFGFNIIGTKNIVHPLFDLKDLRIQSNTGKRMKKNYGIKSDEIVGSTTLEIFSPHLVDDVLQYTQLDDYVYCLTDKTNIGPVFRKSDIYLQKRMLSAEQSTSTSPVYSYYYNPYDSDRTKYQINGDLAMMETLVNHNPAYTYTPLFELRLSGEENYSDLCATPVSSYYHYLSSYEDNYAGMISTLFRHRYNFENIDRNYILELPIRKAKYDYSDGTIKGDLLLAKNIYDESYSVHLCSDISSSRQDPNIINKYREYLGIGSCGGYVFLKYYDDIQCKAEYFDYPRDNEGFMDKRGLIQAGLDKNSYHVPADRTYQKVEQIRSVNRYIATTKHKANLFSINVNHLEEALDYSEEYRSNRELKEKIKEDIDNSIRNLVKNLSPAHTQYYKTFFENDKIDNGC